MEGLSERVSRKKDPWKTNKINTNQREKENTKIVLEAQEQC